MDEKKKTAPATDEQEAIELGSGITIERERFGNATGRIEGIQKAAAVMLTLGNMLLSSDKKVRVTIECDPETGRFLIEREELS